MVVCIHYRSAHLLDDPTLLLEKIKLYPDEKSASSVHYRD